MNRIWVFLFIAFQLGACTTTKYVPVETVRVDSVYRVQQRVDSIYERDSVYVYAKADTVWMTKMQIRYRDKWLRDTVYRVKCDTVKSCVEVERELSRVERLKMDIGTGVLWTIPIIIGLFVVYRKFIK